MGEFEDAWEDEIEDDNDDAAQGGGDARPRRDARDAGSAAVRADPMTPTTQAPSSAAP